MLGTSMRSTAVVVLLLLGSISVTLADESLASTSNAVSRYASSTETIPTPVPKSTTSLVGVDTQTSASTAIRRFLTRLQGALDRVRHSQVAHSPSQPKPSSAQPLSTVTSGSSSSNSNSSDVAGVLAVDLSTSAGNAPSHLTSSTVNNGQMAFKTLDNEPDDDDTSTTTIVIGIILGIAGVIIFVVIACACRQARLRRTNNTRGQNDPFLDATMSPDSDAAYIPAPTHAPASTPSTNSHNATRYAPTRGHGHHTPLNNLSASNSRTAMITSSSASGNNNRTSSSSSSSSSTSSTTSSGSKKSLSLDDFAPISVLGEGTFGKVSLVRELSTGCVFAMKVLKKERVKNEGQVGRTKAERNVLASIDNPFIVKLHASFQTDTKLFFILDYHSGGDLYFLITREGRLAENHMRYYACNLIIALGYLHSRGVLYRDLKPENVLLSSDGHAVLTDFGLCKELEDAGGDHVKGKSTAWAHSFVGTPEYLAPEVILGQAYGPAADFYALGVTLFEIHTGQPPFYHTDRNKLYRRTLQGTVQYPYYMSLTCRSFISGLLERDPAKRLGSKGGAEELKRHPFFRGVDWKAVAEKRAPVPYIPPHNPKSPLSQNFEKRYTEMPVFSQPTNAGGMDMNNLVMAAASEGRQLAAAAAAGAIPNGGGAVEEAKSGNVLDKKADGGGAATAAAAATSTTASGAAAANGSKVAEGDEEEDDVDGMEEGQDIVHSPVTNVGIPISPNSNTTSIQQQQTTGSAKKAPRRNKQSGGGEDSLLGQQGQTFAGFSFRGGLLRGRSDSDAPQPH